MQYFKMIFILGGILLGLEAYAQDVTFSLANPQFTNGGNTYEVDVMISSSSGFKLGSGQFYLNYNELAFGANVADNARITVNRPTGSLLGTLVGNPPFHFPYYTSFITNDNTNTRVSFSWQQAFSEACLPGANVNGPPQLLARVQFTFIGGGALSPDICFESSELFTNQTFTACGPNFCSNVDCQGTPGTQITNDSYNCSALLPIELLSFRVIREGEDARLSWRTSLEIGSSHFEIEKSIDGRDWKTIGYQAAAGNSTTELQYRYIDAGFRKENPAKEQFFYRLKMIDLDGSYEYSPLASLQVRDTKPQLQVYPNPVAESEKFQITLSGLQNERDISYTIFDSRGRVFQEQSLSNGLEPANGVFVVNTTALPVGLYFLCVSTGKEAIFPMERLIIQ